MVTGQEAGSQQQGDNLFEFLSSYAKELEDEAGEADPELREKIALLQRTINSRDSVVRETVQRVENGGMGMMFFDRNNKRPLCLRAMCGSGVRYGAGGWLGGLQQGMELIWMDATAVCSHLAAGIASRLRSSPLRIRSGWGEGKRRRQTFSVVVQVSTFCKKPYSVCMYPEGDVQVINVRTRLRHKGMTCADRRCKSCSRRLPTRTVKWP
eukprot:753945-Hanusia_phi.AAC.2